MSINKNDTVGSSQRYCRYYSANDEYVYSIIEFKTYCKTRLEKRKKNKKFEFYSFTIRVEAKSGKVISDTNIHWILTHITTHFLVRNNILFL
jgi:Fe-S cluster assembly iron-binding protein IscA